MPSAALAQCSAAISITALPIFDLSEFTTGEAEKRVATTKEVVETFKTYGFVYSVNHGIAEEEVDGMFEWSRRLFSLPEDYRMSEAILRPKAPEGKHSLLLRGYTPTGCEKLSQDTNKSSVEALRAVPDVKDMFEMGPNKGPAASREPNRHPARDLLPGFEEFTQMFFQRAHSVGMDILRCIAVGLDLEEDYFVNYHRDADNLFRLIRYPPIERAQMRAGTKARTSPHTDFGSITLLFQDEVGGLEVENPAKPGTYVQATPIKGAIIVNVADFLMRWTNDVLKSILHRVVEPPAECTLPDGMELTKERYSMPFFIQADRHRMIECTPGLGGNGPKYGPISPAEYLHRRVSATLKDS